MRPAAPTANAARHETCRPRSNSCPSPRPLSGAFATCHRTPRAGFTPCDTPPGAAPQRPHLVLGLGGRSAPPCLTPGASLLTLDRRACLNHGLVHPLENFTLDDWYATIHADDREPARQGLARAIAGHGTMETRYRVVRADGSPRTLEIEARAHYDAQGRAV